MAADRWMTTFVQAGRGNAPVDTAVNPYEVATLSPRTTGLPLTVWVSPRERARHDARIKVSLTPGKIDTDNVAVVAIRPAPERLTEGLGNGDFEAIARWIGLNEAALIDYWDEAIDTADLIGRLLKV